jgi:hypothetical protein
MVSACLPWRKLLSPAERRAPMVELAPARLIGPERAVKRFGRSARRRGSEDRGEAWADLEDDRGLGTEGRPFTSAIGRAAPFYEFNVSRDLARGSARRSCWLEELLDRFRPIVWKNPQNDRSRKSRFHAPNLICAGNRHDKAHGRATRGKTARAAEPLPNFPSRSSIAV